MMMRIITRKNVSPNPTPPLHRISRRTTIPRRTTLRARVVAAIAGAKATVVVAPIVVAQIVVAQIAAAVGADAGVAAGDAIAADARKART
jgi:hypothetical protein